MKRIITILCLFSFVLMPIWAQRRKSKAVEKKQPSAQELMFDNMLPSTRRVMVVDSMVVSKRDFLSHIPLPDECGVLAHENEGAAFINDFINRKYFSRRDTEGVSAIYTADRLAGKWTEPQALKTLGNADYPFLMADGTTLYFAAKGEASLGGYDLFVTRYDADSGTLLEPQNMGLPFNSTANDYLYAEDETDSLAWLVTDRNQADSMVCIYTLVPDGHTAYDVSQYSADKLKSLARIASIRDTWTDQQQKNAALQRLYALRNGKAKAEESGGIWFVVNDKTTYTSLSQFKSPSNKENFIRLQAMKESLDDNFRALKRLREQYKEAVQTAQRALSDKILALEKEIMTQEKTIRKTEISIRNTENMLE